MADEITAENIADAALNPAKVRTDAGEVQARTIDELIAARNAAAGSAIAAAGGNGWGTAIGRARLVPPGTTGPLATET